MSVTFLVAAAFLAGLVSFSSPCCLPLLPGYVAYVSGNEPTQRAGRTMRAAALFTLGFGATFTALGASASWLGAALLAGRPALVRAAGVLVVTVGVLTAFGAESAVLARERRLLALHRIPRGPLFAAPLGAAVARGQGRGRGLGLLGRHHRLLARVGGTLLVAMGLAMVAGWWTQLFGPLVRWFARSGWPPACKAAPPARARRHRARPQPASRPTPSGCAWRALRADPSSACPTTSRAGHWC